MKPSRVADGCRSTKLGHVRSEVRKAAAATAAIGVSQIELSVGKNEGEWCEDAVPGGSVRARIARIHPLVL